MCRLFGSRTRAPSAVSHELFHGVTFSTARFANSPGYEEAGLNEGTAAFFAQMVIAWSHRPAGASDATLAQPLPDASDATFVQPAADATLHMAAPADGVVALIHVCPMIHPEDPLFLIAGVQP